MKERDVKQERMIMLDVEMSIVMEEVLVIIQLEDVSAQADIGLEIDAKIGPFLSAVMVIANVIEEDAKMDTVFVILVMVV